MAGIRIRIIFDGHLIRIFKYSNICAHHWYLVQNTLLYYTALYYPSLYGPLYGTKLYSTALNCIVRWVFIKYTAVLVSTQSHYTTHSTAQHATHYILRTAHYTLCTTHCTLHTAHYALNTTHCTVYTAHFTLHTIHYTIHKCPIISYFFLKYFPNIWQG